tara:strand:- start:610 stop:903 length:294 start_codon:yes stop_codon:yes gene_type:complete
MLLKVATPFTTVEVILEGIEKVIVLLSDAPIHTRPAARVNVEVLDVVFTVKLICAFAADLERGTYPIFLAKETTFSLKVAESKKDSFTTMFELNAVM